MSSTGTRKCYVCKQAGHQSRDCPQNTAAAAAAPTPAPPATHTDTHTTSGSGTRKCYVCKQAGHQSKDCPQAGSAARPAAAKKAASSDGDFKSRLAEHKAKVEAAGPNAPKPLFCYLCGKDGHRERDCPRNTKVKEDKTCLKCGEPDHIARYCPTIANRTVYRQETKDRTKVCYICSEDGHHATECPELDSLAEEFPKFLSKLQSGLKLHVKVYNILMAKCARAMEINGALYLYQQMIERKVEPNEDTMKHLEYLHDRGGKDQSRLEEIPKLKKRVALLKDIVTSKRRAAKKDELTDSVVTHLAAYLRDTPGARESSEKCSSLFELAKHLKKESSKGAIKNLTALSSNDARLALSTLRSFGRYHQKSKSCEFDLGEDATVDLTQPGKFVKKESTAETNGKNKKAGSSSSKKKTRSKKRKADSDAAAAPGEEQKEDAPAAKKAKKEEEKKSESGKSSSDKKRKADASVKAESTEASSKSSKKSKVKA